MSLIRNNDDHETKNGLKIHKAKMMIETATFSDTFGPKAQRKKPTIGLSNFEELAGESTKMHDTYLDKLEQAKLLSGQSGPDSGPSALDEDLQSGVLAAPREQIFSAGQSRYDVSVMSEQNAAKSYYRRIWNELYSKCIRNGQSASC